MNKMRTIDYATLIVVTVLAITIMIGHLIIKLRIVFKIISLIIFILYMIYLFSTDKDGNYIKHSKGD